MEELLVARHPYSGRTDNLQLEELLREEDDEADDDDEQLSRRFDHLERMLRDDDDLYLQQISRGDQYDEQRRTRPCGRSQTSTLSTQEITGMASIPPTDVASIPTDPLHACTYGDSPITAKPPPSAIHQSFQKSMNSFSSFGGNMPKFQFPAVGKKNNSESGSKTPPLYLFPPSNPTEYSGASAPVNNENQEEKRRLLSMPILGLTNSTGAAANDNKTAETAATSPFSNLWPPMVMSQNSILEEIRSRREAAAAASTLREQAPRSGSSKQQQSSSSGNPLWPTPLTISDSIRNLDANANAAVSDLVSRLDGTKQEEIQRRQSRKPRADMDVPLSSKATTSHNKKSSRGKKKKRSSERKRISSSATVKEKSGTS